MFRHVMTTVADYVEQSDDVTFLSDGERRYRNILFNLCAETLQDGRRERPPKYSPIYKSSCEKQRSQPTIVENKRPKYEAPWREHQETKQNLEETDIHANHLEAQTAALHDDVTVPDF